MKKFLIKSILFISPLLLCFIYLEVELRSLDTFLKQKKEYLESNVENIEVLVLGNSHALNGINPADFNLNTFNLGMGSQSLFYDFGITKKYVTRMPKLKYVLISLDYHTLYHTNSENRDFLYTHYYGLRYKEGYQKSDLSMLFYGFGLKKGIDMVFTSTPEVAFCKGWIGYEGSNKAELSLKSGENRVAFFNEMINENRDYKNAIVDQIESFVGVLDSLKIQPVFVTLPCSQYFKTYADSMIWNENIAIVKQLNQKYNIPYLNFYENDMEDKYFFNSDHMNKDGAQVISKDIDLFLEQRSISK